MEYPSVSSPLEDLMRVLESEAREKRYSREDLEMEVEVVRGQLVKIMYEEKSSENHARSKKGV